MSLQSSGPPSPSFFSGVSVIFRMQVRRFARGKKLRLALVATGLIVFAVAAARYAASGNTAGVDTAYAVEKAEEAVSKGLRWGFFSLLVFLLPFLFTSSAIGEEVEGRTFTYLAGRPVGRIAIAVGKWAAGTIIAVLLIIASILLLHIAAYATEPTALVEAFPSTLRAAAGASLLTCAYCSMCMCFGALVPEAAGVVAALYLGVIEFVGSMLPGAFRCVSINYSAQQLVGLEKGGIAPEHAPDIAPMIAAAVLVLFSLVFVMLTAVVVQTSEYRFSRS